MGKCGNFIIFLLLFFLHEINFREFRSCNTPLFCHSGLLNFVKSYCKVDLREKWSQFHEILSNLFLIFYFFSFSGHHLTPNGHHHRQAGPPGHMGTTKVRNFMKTWLFVKSWFSVKITIFFSCYSPTSETNPNAPSTPEMALLQNVGGPFNP